MTDGSKMVTPKASISHSFNSSDECTEVIDVIKASWWLTYIWNSFKEHSYNPFPLLCTNKSQEATGGWVRSAFTPMHLDRPTSHLFGPCMLCLIITQKWNYMELNNYFGITNSWHADGLFIKRNYCSSKGQRSQSIEGFSTEVVHAGWRVSIYFITMVWGSQNP